MAADRGESQRVLALTLLLGVSTLLLGSAAVAAQPSITVEPLPCLPTEDNAVVRAEVADDVPGGRLRLYFRRVQEDRPAFYWLEMVPEAPGRYWAVLPKPEEQDGEPAEIYAALVDGSGDELARGRATEIPVTDDCVSDLVPLATGLASSLTVGETDVEQVGRPLFHWLCDGVDTRVDPDGVRRQDEVCRACVVS